MVRQDRSDRRGGVHKKGKGHYDDHYHHGGPKTAKTPKKPVDENSPVIAVFRTFQTELDGVHDKYERLIKLSRDVTIDSKRVIFLLHRISDDEKKASVLEEANSKIANVKQRLCQIAQELQGEDPYRYMRAISPGAQEFIEALLFYHYIKNNKLLGHKELEEQLSFEVTKGSDTEGSKVTKGQDGGKKQQKGANVKKPEEEKSQETDMETKTEADEDSTKEPESCDTDCGNEAPPETIKIELHIPPNEYMLGMADFTGELMRMCINSVGSGDRETPFQLVSFMREIYDGFQLLGNTPTREVVRKLYTMRQSLKKVENTCYTLHVRGSEIPEHMLLDAIASVEKGERGFGDDGGDE